MKRTLIAAAALAALVPAAAAAQIERVEKGALVLENVPETPAAMRDRLRQYQNVRGASFQGFPADGDGVLVSTRFGQTAQVHHVATPLGARRQLTFFDEPVSGVAASPSDGAMFAFARDRGGDENFQAFVFDREAGRSTRISDGAGRKGAVTWSR
ncbi:MAG: S9 family peptidase, partial [Pseudomonadota bacterium]